MVARRAAQPRAEQRVDHELRSVIDELASLRAEDLRRDLPVAAIRPLAGVEHDAPRIGKAPQSLVGDRTAGALHHRVDVVALLGRLHLG